MESGSFPSSSGCTRPSRTRIGGSLPPCIGGSDQGQGDGRRDREVPARICESVSQHARLLRCLDGGVGRCGETTSHVLADESTTANSQGSREPHRSKARACRVERIGRACENGLVLAISSSRRQPTDAIGVDRRTELTRPAAAGAPARIGVMTRFVVADAGCRRGEHERASPPDRARPRRPERETRRPRALGERDGLREISGGGENKVAPTPDARAESAVEDELLAGEHDDAAKKPPWHRLDVNRREARIVDGIRGDAGSRGRNRDIPAP